MVVSPRFLLDHCCDGLGDKIIHVLTNAERTGDKIITRLNLNSVSLNTKILITKIYYMNLLLYHYLFPYCLLLVNAPRYASETKAPTAICIASKN